MSNPKAREEMEARIVADYPELNPFVLRNLMDLYFSEDGKVALDNIVKEQVKREKKKPHVINKTSPPTEIITNVEVRRWEDSGLEERIAEERSKVFQIISPEIVEPVAE